jgi:hypothetical protein
MAAPGKPTQASPPPDRPVRECAAGKDCGGRYEHEEPLFTFKDYVYMAVGISSRPVPIQRKCALCNHVWEIEQARRPW